MKIIDLIHGERPCLSFEVFPPKNNDSYESVCGAADAIAALKPSFMSVTYGAGGGTSNHTASLAGMLQKNHALPCLAHLSCVHSSRAGILAQLDALKSNGIQNILALRGDLAPGESVPAHWHYRFANQLVEEICAYGGFCVGGACYPEGHTESPSQKQDILHLKQKVEAGCSFLTTQMFFDNHVYYNFLYKIREAGISVPVVAGIMPVTNAKQIKRIVQLSGTALPQRFRYILDHFADNPAAMKQAGIAYATEQIVDLLANGVPAVHVYSMNNFSVAEKIKENLSDILA